MIEVELAAALIFGLVAVWQSIRAERLARQVAAAERVFAKPRIDITVFGLSGRRHFIIAAPLDVRSIIELPMLLEIANVGDKTAEDVEVYYRVPASLHYGGLAAATPVVTTDHAKFVRPECH